MRRQVAVVEGQLNVRRKAPPTARRVDKPEKQKGEMLNGQNRLLR